MAPPGGNASETRARTGPQVDEDMRLQRAIWTAERIGWASMAVLAVAALLGLFSAGPLSRTMTSDGAGLVQVEYERFLRRKAPSSLRVELSGPAAGDTVSLRVSRPVFDAFQITQVQPQPERTLATSDGWVFTFRLDAPDRPGTVIFAMKPQAVGLVRGEIGMVGREPARLVSFVYP